MALYWQYMDTPIGQMVAAASDKGICMLEFLKEGAVDAFAAIQKLAEILQAVPEENVHPYFGALQSQLKAYFEGHLKQFDLPLAQPGTTFQQGVWSGLLKIPYGVTRTYMQQAIALNNPKAIRAVGHANGQNRIAIIVPCHRVIGANGQLTGYAGGLWRKQALQAHEQKHTGNYQLKLL